jgi:hypothetical protein
MPVGIGFTADESPAGAVLLRSPTTMMTFAKARYFSSRQGRGAPRRMCQDCSPIVPEACAVKVQSPWTISVLGPAERDGEVSARFARAT